MNIKKLTKILAILLITNSMTGCVQQKEKEVIFESGVNNNNTTNVNFNEEVLELQLDKETAFSPLYYSNDNIIGNIYYTGVVKAGNEDVENFPIGGSYKENLYLLNDNGELNDTGISDWGNIFNYGKAGLSNNWFDKSKDVYYFNRETGERKEVGTYPYSVSTIIEQKIFRNGEHYYQGLVEGTEDFGYILYNYGKGAIKLVNLQIIDLRNNKTYSYKVQSEEEQYICDILYNKATESIYVVKGDGSIHKVILENESINFEEKVKVELKNLNLLFGTLGSGDSNAGATLGENGEIIIYRAFEDELLRDDKRLMIIYDPSTNEVKEIYQGENENFNTVKKIRNSDYWILEKVTQRNYAEEAINQEYYIGKINNGKIDIYHKLDIPLEYGDKLYFFNGVANDDASEIFLRLKKEDTYTPDAKDIYMKLKVEK